MASTDADETVRYTMRTNAVQDGIWRRAKCLVHADCRLYGRMVQPSGRRVDLRTRRASGLGAGVQVFLKRDLAPD